MAYPFSAIVIILLHAVKNVATEYTEILRKNSELSVGSVAMMAVSPFPGI
jgi:hypothetical protein